MTLQEFNDLTILIVPIFQQLGHSEGKQRFPLPVLPQLSKFLDKVNHIPGDSLNWKVTIGPPGLGSLSDILHTRSEGKSWS